MTLPNHVPTGYAGTAADFAKVPGYDASGAARIVSGTVTVPATAAQNDFVGLFPFNKGARIHLHDKAVHIGNVGGGSLTVDLGVIYDDNTNNTNDEDAFSSASAAGQAGGFIDIDEIAGHTFVATGNGWLAVKLEAAGADAEGLITFNAIVAYG